MGFWTDIRERRITQVVFTYLAGGWVGVAVLGELVDRSILSELVYRFALVAFVGGFFASLIVGWFHGEKGRQEVTPLEVVLLVLVGLGSLGGGVGVARQYAIQQRIASVADLEFSLDVRRIAVTYFDDLSDSGELAHVADGLTEDLIDRLSQVRELDVVSRNGVGAFRGASRDSLIAALNVGTVIEGAIESSGDRIKATIRLIDGEGGTEIKRSTLDWPADEAQAMRGEIAEEVSRDLREWLGEEIRLSESRSAAVSMAAWTLLQRGERARKSAEVARTARDLQGLLGGFASADSFLVSALDLEPDWIEPRLMRGWIAYELGRLAGSRGEAVAFLDQAAGHAAAALVRDPNNGAAFELRGTQAYFRWLLQVTPDHDEAAQLLAGARADLERAVQADPRLASAYSTLSHLYYTVRDRAEAVLAGRRAYEEDAYLRVADAVLWRLYTASYDMEQGAQAERWCEEGYTRFPHDPRFTECRLWLMTMLSGEPVVDEAWRLLAQLDELTPEGDQATMLRGRMIVGGILARASLPDSARSVLLSARGGVDAEQELLAFEAVMRVMLGDRDEAVDLLRRYSAANPGHFTAESSGHWWYRDLRGHPDFQALLSLN